MARYKSIGLGMLAILLVLLGIPLWQGWRGHPLAASEHIDVCALVRAAPLRELLEAPGDMVAGMPGAAAGETADPTCHVELARDAEAADGARFVTTVLMTERGLARGGRRQGSQAFVETWLAEARASGSRVEDVPGPWRGAALVRPASPDMPGLQLLADDAGVILWFRSAGVEPKLLTAFAGATARAARQAGSQSR